ncbi:hypothetical protein BX600DRAFT_544505 [Xylariales sp. PMI_506]|nr:hypothetical protein BX600DRAFT_544505 [Xylariales sp. PMI_506]
MAVMDNFEQPKPGAGSRESTREEGELKSEATSSSASASHSLPFNQPTAAKRDFRFQSGPSPQKGSGQDRFRQMMAEPPSGSRRASLSANPKRTLAITTPSGMDEGFCSSDGTYVASAGPYITLAQQGLLNDLPTRPSHFVAINPAMYPIAAVHAASSLPAPGTGNRVDRGSRDRGGGSSVTWTSVLSSECQMRRFNPQFHEWITPDGFFKASVNLNGVTMHDTRQHKSPVDAKQAIARRAVEFVQGLSIPAGASSRGLDTGSSSERNREISGNRTRHGGVSNTRSESIRWTSSSYRPPSPVSKAEEERRLLTRIQSHYAGSGYPSETILENPAASRAFLEGFALGSKLRDSTRSRRRSRSPSDSRKRRSREREKSAPTPNERRAHRERSTLRSG